MTEYLDPKKAERIEPIRTFKVDDLTLTPRPSFRAYRLLQAGFVLLSLLTGADKFFHRLTDWSRYLAGPIGELFPVRVQAYLIDAPMFMRIVGGIEIAAALLIALVPRVGAAIVSVLLLGIGVQLLLLPGLGDLAVRDLALSFSAAALGLLAKEYGRPLWRAY